MERDVQQALDETAQLAQRVYPALLDGRGLGATLRAMAAASGRNARVQGTIGAGCPPEIVSAVYFSVLDVLEHASAEVTVTVREEDGAVVFHVIENETRSDAELDRVRDRVEALGGRLTVLSEAGLGTGVSGSLPLAR